ncbi:hypothetical protein [Planctomycetes bacterium Poly30]
MEFLSVIPFYPRANSQKLTELVEMSGHTDMHRVGLDDLLMWTVYVGQALEGDESLTDADPIEEVYLQEGSLLGQAYAEIYTAHPVRRFGFGGPASWVYWETISDSYALNDPTERSAAVRMTLAHEVGHQLGLPHVDKEGFLYGPGSSQNSLKNLMWPDAGSHSLDLDFYSFSNFHVSLLRLLYKAD